MTRFKELQHLCILQSICQFRLWTPGWFLLSSRWTQQQQLSLLLWHKSLWYRAICLTFLAFRSPTTWATWKPETELFSHTQPWHTEATHKFVPILFSSVLRVKVVYFWRVKLCVFTLQDNGKKCTPSDAYECANEVSAHGSCLGSPQATEHRTSLYHLV